MRVAFLVIPLIAALVPIASAAAPIPPVFDLPEVVIPGRRPQPAAATPASVSVLTREDLEALGVQTLAEALQLLPEAFVRAYGGPGGLAEPSIRGFGPGQVLVLLDGVPLNNVALGQTDLSTISLTGVARIEVLRGPFAALAGSGALGGVINIVTGESGSAATVRYGGAGERRLAISGGRAGFTYGLDLDGGDGFRPNSDHADVTVRLDLRPAPDRRISLHHHRASLGSPGDASAPTPLDRQSSVRTVVQGQWPAGPSQRVRLFYTAERLVFDTPFGTSTYTAVLAGGEWQRQWMLAPARILVAGVEAQGQRLDAEIFGSPIGESAVTAAGYLQYDAALSARALASIGVRLDAHSRYGTALNPRLGIVLARDERTRIRAAVGRTFRGPTFLHLFFPGCSNPDLTAETAWAAEVGIEHLAPSGIFGATAFAAEARNLISGGCPPLNVNEASFRGISLDGRMALGERTQLRLNLTAQQAVDRMTGASLPRVPALSLNAAFTYRLSDGSSFVAIAHYVGARRDVDFSVFPAAMADAPSYVDLALRYQRSVAGGWTVTLGIDNALDAGYQVVTGFPAPGRRVFVSAAGRF